MRWDQLLRLLVMLLATFALAGGAMAIQPLVDDGALGIVFEEGDGSDEGAEDEKGDEEGDEKEDEGK